MAQETLILFSEIHTVDKVDSEKYLNKRRKDINLK